MAGDCAGVLMNNWPTQHIGKWQGLPKYNETCQRFTKNRLTKSSNSKCEELRFLQNTKRQFERAFLNLTTEEMREISHQPRDMILGCITKANVYNQLCENFETEGGSLVFSPTKGVCYSINLNSFPPKNLSQSVEVKNNKVLYR